MASSLPPTMKAAKRISSGPLDRTLMVTNVPLPKNATSLPPDHLLVKVSYTSLNPFDCKLAEAPLLGRLVYPEIPCLDFSGAVVASNTARFNPSQMVYGQTQPPNFGACAEYVVVAENYCMPLPDGVKLEDAATIGIAGLTAYQAIVPFVKSGDKVFINGGSGGIGTYGIQFAKAVGCSITTSCSGPNEDLCRSLGADEVIDYRIQNVVETLRRRGKQYDLVVDNVFSDVQLYWSCHDFVKTGGKFITMAASPNLSFLRDLLSIKLWPSFIGGGRRDFQLVGRVSKGEDYEQIAKWLEGGTVKVVMDRIYGLEDVKEAFGRLKSGRARGKLVVKVG